MSESPFILFRKFTVPLHALCLYAAAGVAAFGWVIARLLHFPAEHYLPLWFFGTLGIYNLDRLKKDPADAVNLPLRSGDASRFLGWSHFLAILSGAAVLFFPIFQRDWPLLFLVVLAGAVSSRYSIPLAGVRIKDLPVVKTLFVPSLVACALLYPAVRNDMGTLVTPVFLATATWVWLVLLFNMIVCDQRDAAGDRETGVVTIPVVLGDVGTRRLLYVLLVLAAVCAGFLATRTRTGEARFWGKNGLAMTIYLSALLHAIREKRSESFYEWWVEGILYLPLVLSIAFA